MSQHDWPMSAQNTTSDIPTYPRRVSALTATDVVEYYRYVPRRLRSTFETLGWVFAADLPGGHGHWSVLMMWAGDREPREPELGK
jgi:hypothetical protein